MSFLVVSSVQLYMKNLIPDINLSEIEKNLMPDSNLQEHEKFRTTQKWMSYDNKITLIKDLSNEHLINIIGHCGLVDGYSIKYRNHLINEFCFRKLPKEDLKKFQIPHIDQNGNTVLMSYDKDTLYQTYSVK